MRGALARLAAAAFPRFLLVGAIGFLVDVGVFVAARALMPDIAARISALSVAITTTWWLNRRLTFRSDDPQHVTEWLRYVAISSIGAATNASISLVLLWSFPGISTVIAVGAGSIVALFVNFVLAKRIAYRVPSSVSASSTPYS